MSGTTLWTQYQVEGDLAARDELLMQNIRLVHHVARQVIRSSRIDAEFDDLVSAGTIGLMNAVDNFDPSRGLAFSTFAAPRIRGAILDDLRRRDHVPRSIRRKQRELNRAKESLMATLDRLPTDGEVAQEMGIDEDKFRKWEREAEQATRVSLDRPLDPSRPRSSTPEEVLPGADGADTIDALNQNEELQILRDEILELKEQERIVLSLYYFEELKLHEIASVMGVTESRISQIRSKAIKSLRARLSGLRESAVL